MSNAETAPDASNDLTSSSSPSESEPYLCSLSEIIDVEEYFPNNFTKPQSSVIQPIDIDSLENDAVADIHPHVGRIQSQIKQSPSQPDNGANDDITFVSEKIKPLVDRKSFVELDDDEDDAIASPAISATENAIRCPICFKTLSQIYQNDFESDPMTRWCATRCGHIFCQPCIVAYLCNKNRCPLCRCTLAGKSDIIHLFL